MAKENRSFLLLLSFLSLLISPSVSISETSLNAAITSLRSNSYTLFGNAILTSDLYTDLLSNNNVSFTLFAPTDPSLFTLDISTRADLYVSSLRRHVAIGRLQSLTPPFPDSLPSLLPDHPVSLSLINGSGIVTANGVVIIAPRIFDGPDLTVHGLAGMLPVRFAYPPSITPTLSSPPTFTPTLSSPPSITPTLSSLSSISPTLSSPPSISPTSNSPASISPTSSSPASISPTSSSPASISPTSSSPPSISPTSSSPPLNQVVEAPMAELNQISMPPDTGRSSLDEISPSPMVLRNGEEWWCLTGEVEEAGCFKVSSALGLANASPPMTGVEGGI
jgi:hypothetical protein